MKNITQVVVIAVIRHGNQYLMTKRKEKGSFFDGKWQLPGGGLEFEEKIEDCLHREVMEETGLELSDCKYIPVVYEDIRDNWHGVFFNFLCTLKNPNQEIKLDHEASEYGWYTLDEARKLESFPDTIMLIEEAEKMGQ